MQTDCSLQQLTFWNIDKQEIKVDFQGGRVVSDAGLLSLRAFDQKLRITADWAQQFPDPRAQQFVVYSSETLLTQRVYQILGGYPDANDAQELRHDPLFVTIGDVSPEPHATLASGSTLNRFHYAYTRRENEVPVEDRSVLLEQQAALNQRIGMTNEYLVGLFMRTRVTPPRFIILDLDATDDPTHGQQYLSFFHGYFDQHQYFPLLIFDGDTGFPLAAWLRPGKAHASWGAVDALRDVVTRVRQQWPDVIILVRADTGFATPEMYEYCEAEGLLYAFGYASNDVLKRQTDPWLSDLQTYYAFYGWRAGGSVQRFETIKDYQAASWGRPRTIIAKMEITRSGDTNRRFVVTNLSGHPEGIYRGFYVQRGDVPEKPIGELKNALHADRLSQHGFRANALRLLEHVMAYAIVVLYREAAAAVPEVARAEVGTLRQKLWKVGAVVRTSVRKIWFHFSETWVYRDLWQRVHQTVMAYAERLIHGPAAGAIRPVVPLDLPLLPLL